MEYISVKDAMEDGKEVALRGWVYRERSQKELVFIVLRDSSGIIQCAVKKGEVSDEIFKEASKLTIESSIEISGKVVKDERAPGGFEVKVSDLKVHHLAERFPIGKDLSEDYLMTVRHLWLRSQKMMAIMKIRSTVFGAIHDYFRGKDYYEFHSPILNKSACEGGPTLFKVDYFDDEVYLTQSWQLYGEAAVTGLEKIYTIAPSFRAEKSRTSRHLTEYWHAEMEIAWAHLDDIAKEAEGLLSHICQVVAEKHPEDLKTLGRDPEDLKKIKPPFPRIKYKDALELIKEDGMDVPYGKDLRTEEEKAIALHFDKPIIVTHYPKEIMAFYKPEDPEDPGTALCMDVLAPEIGIEIIGGSERSLDIEQMKKDLKREKADPKDYDWYFDTRRYGAVPHSGFGMGVERVIQWICKLDSIRDAIGFPRTMTRYTP